MDIPQNITAAHVDDFVDIFVVGRNKKRIRISPWKGPQQKEVSKCWLVP